MYGGRLIMQAFWVLLAAAAMLLAPGRAGAQTAPAGFDHQGLAKQVLERHIRPLYAELAAKAHDFRQAVEAACQRHDAKDSSAIETAYRALLLAWSRTEHLRFGPVVDGNRYERVVYWPDRQRIGERQIGLILSKGDPAALTAGALAKKSVAVQGLIAAELVVYGKARGQLLSDAPEAKFSCGYVSAIATNISAIAKEIVAEWADDAVFTALWLQPGEQNPVYKTDTDTTIEILKAYRAGIYNARDLKLLPSLGLKRIALRGQLAPKSRPPFELSGLGLAAMTANVEGALDLYVNGGLAERLAAVEPQAAELTRGQLESAIAGMRALEPAGLAAFNEPPIMDKLALVRDPLGLALSEGAATLAEIAGLGALLLGFTDDDGD
jgi:predicted lipoprotein